MTTGLEGLYRLSDAASHRTSSWDVRGKNRDYVHLKPGDTAVLADISGSGCINHIYCIVIDPTNLVYRKMVMRMYWDGESTPSAEVPLGDFFCVSHCLPRPVRSLLVTANPGNNGTWCPSSYGLNAYFPMPFAKGARLTLEYEQPEGSVAYPLMFWYHIDYEQRSLAPEETARFHAQWRRELLTKSAHPDQTNVTLWDGENLDGSENFVMLDASGRGRLLGLHLQVDNVAGGWYGEGDDMIWIDGKGWPPRMHGTGTEEIFGGGACPCEEYTGPYTGFHLIENTNFSGKNGMYRWHVRDPVYFAKSIQLSIEHGHANNFENDCSSVAYWYQEEPHQAFPALPRAAQRLPRVSQALFQVEEKIGQILAFQPLLEERLSESAAFGTVWKLVNDGAEYIVQGRLGDALGVYQGNLGLLETYVR